METWGNFHSYQTSVGKTKKTDTNCFVNTARSSETFPNKATLSLKTTDSLKVNTSGHQHET